jgi:hypothetical protein
VDWRITSEWFDVSASGVAATEEQVERWHPLSCPSWRAMASLKNFFLTYRCLLVSFRAFFTQKLHLFAQQFREQPERCYISPFRL